MEIVISPLAKGNAYNSTINYTHSSDLLTGQEMFGVGPCLADACNATDLADLYRPGTLSNGGTNNAPEPASLALLASGFLGVALVCSTRGKPSNEMLCQAALALERDVDMLVWMRRVGIAKRRVAKSRDK
jgi:PEP-CTERM motif